MIDIDLHACMRANQDSIATLTQNVTELKSDIERHIAIASQLATEVEGLRAERERLLNSMTVIANGPPTEMANDEVASWAAHLALYALASPPATEANKHLCGLQGYDPMKDPPCPGCVDRHRPTEGDAR